MIKHSIKIVLTTILHFTTNILIYCLCRLQHACFYDMKGCIFFVMEINLKLIFYTLCLIFFFNIFCSLLPCHEMPNILKL